MSETSRQLCTFRVDSLYLGIDVEEVQEVIRYQEMTRVPLAPSAVHGLINLRGQIVTALDMRTRLGLPAQESGRQPMNVVVRTEDGAVSLLVDEIGDVTEVCQESFENPPTTLSAEARSLIEGAYKLDDRLLLVLNKREAIDVSQQEHVVTNRS